MTVSPWIIILSAVIGSGIFTALINWYLASRSKKTEASKSYSERELDEASKIRGELRRDIQTVRTEIAEQHRLNLDLTKKYNELSLRHTVLEKDYKELEGNYGSLKGRYDTLRKEHGILVSEHNKLTAKFYALEKATERA